MEIKASCKLDLASVCALTRLSMFKKADPKKRLILWTVLLSFLAVVVLAELALWGYDGILRTLLILIVFYIVLLYVWYFLAPRLQYRSMAKLKDVVNEYVFTDDALRVSNRSADYSAESVLSYSMLVKAYETSRYIFLYQTNRQVLIVDKITVEGGSAYDIRYKLASFLKEKYIICSY